MVTQRDVIVHGALDEMRDLEDSRVFCLAVYIFVALNFKGYIRILAAVHIFA